MNDPEKGAKNIGEHIAAAYPERTSQTELNDLRARTLAAAAHTGGTRRRLVAAAALVASVAVVALFVVLDETKLDFSVNGRVGETGNWFHADAGEETSIRFANGSSFSVHPGASAQVAESSEGLVRVELDNGRVSANVVGNGATRWDVQAGPYSVTVLGTTFAVQWRPSTTELEVTVRSGTVLVRGAGLREHGVEVGAGSVLTANARGSQVAIRATGDIRPPEDIENRPSVGLGSTRAAQATRPIDEPVAPSEGDALPRREEATRGQDADPVATASEPSGTPGATAADGGAPEQSDAGGWLVHLEAGRYGAALEVAEADGLDALADSLPLEDLWRLANGARFARRSEGALLLYEAVRRRFPQAHRASTSAFLMAVVKLEIDDDPEPAGALLRTYLREQPTGSLAEEARGRLVDVYLKNGDSESARRAARSYLEHHAGGPFARQANALLGD